MPTARRLRFTLVYVEYERWRWKLKNKNNETILLRTIFRVIVDNLPKSCRAFDSREARRKTSIHRTEFVLFIKVSFDYKLQITYWKRIVDTNFDTVHRTASFDRFSPMVRIEYAILSNPFETETSIVGRILQTTLTFRNTFLKFWFKHKNTNTLWSDRSSL